MTDKQLHTQSNSTTGLNAYEQKQQARKERYLAMAEKKRAESESSCKRSIDMLSVIPLGQPILVGHHSEGGHRSLLKRSDNAMRKACELDETAKYYEHKANSIGKSGISSDDPEAIHKLEKKLEGLKNCHIMMKEANKIVKSKKKDYSQEQKLNDLISLGFSEKNAAELFNPDFCGRIGFAAYVLTNNNSNIKQVESRIAELKRLANHQSINIQNDYFEYAEDKEDNRLLFRFPHKPSEEIRKTLKSHGFNCSPSRNYAWVRKITANALWIVPTLQRRLIAIFESENN